MDIVIVTISTLCALNFPFLLASTLPKKAVQSLPTTRLLITHEALYGAMTLQITYAYKYHGLTE